MLSALGVCGGLHRNEAALLATSAGPLRCGRIEEVPQLCTGMITVRVRYFASLREALGSSEDVILELGSTVGDLRGALTSKDSVYAEMLDTRRPVRSALDHVMCDEQAVLRDGAEVASFPPVTGG